MQALTINELMRLTRTELCALASRIAATLPMYPEGSPERAAACMTLRNIRFVLARRDLSPHSTG